MRIKSIYFLALLLSQFTFYSGSYAQERGSENFRHCNFAENVEINCLLFIKESELVHYHLEINQISKSDVIQPLDSMCYKIHFFDLDIENCKLSFSFAPSSIILPNSEHYLQYFFKATHVYTLSNGYSMMVSIDSSIDVNLLEKILKLREISDEDIVRFKKNKKSYSLLNTFLGIEAIVHMDKNEVKIVKATSPFLKKEYLKFFR